MKGTKDLVQLLVEDVQLLLENLDLGEYYSPAPEVHFLLPDSERSFLLEITNQAKNKIVNQQANIRGLEDKIRRLKLEIELKNDTAKLCSTNNSKDELKALQESYIEIFHELNVYKEYVKIVEKARNTEREVIDNILKDIEHKNIRIRDLEEKCSEMEDYSKSQAVELTNLYKINKDLEDLFNQANNHSIELIGSSSEQRMENLDLKLQLANYEKTVEGLCDDIRNLHDELDALKETNHIEEKVGC